MRYTVETWTSGTVGASSSAVNAPLATAHGVDHSRRVSARRCGRRRAAGRRSRRGDELPGSGWRTFVTAARRRRSYAVAIARLGRAVTGSRPPTGPGRRAGRPGRRPRGRGRRGCPGRRRATPCRSPTSTSVPTIERTIWWQNALARISKRRWRRRRRRLGPAGRRARAGPATARLAVVDLRTAAERREVVLADAAGRTPPASPSSGERLGHEPRPAGEQRVRRRRVPHVVAVVPPRRREPGVEVVGGPRRRRARRSPARTAC